MKLPGRLVDRKRSITAVIVVTAGAYCVWILAALVIRIWWLPRLGYGRQGLDALAAFGLDVAVWGLLGLALPTIGVLCLVKHRSRTLMMFTGLTAGLLASLSLVTRPLLNWMVRHDLLIGNSEATCLSANGREAVTMIVKNLPRPLDAEVYCFVELDPWCKGVVIAVHVLLAILGVYVGLLGWISIGKPSGAVTTVVS